MKPRKKTKSHGDDKFKATPHDEDQTKKAMPYESYMVPSEFGGSFCYRLENDEEIKQRERHQEVTLPYRNDTSNLLVMESYNYDKESNQSPFRHHHEERMKFDQEVQKMMWEIKRAPELVIKGKMVNTQDNSPNKESLEKRRKKNEIYIE